MKKIVWGAAFIGLWIPFILQTNMYPFFRFSMFAEPVKNSIQQEQFYINRKFLTGKEVIFIPEVIGIKKSSLDNLLRNYYYRKEVSVFMEKLKHALPDTMDKSDLVWMRVLNGDTTKVGLITIP